LLAAYSWPENVDELSSVIREAHRRAADSLIAVEDLPKKIQLAAEDTAHPRPRDEPIVLPELLQQIEAELIHRALTRAKGNKTKTAQLLGMNRTRLLRRMAQLDLPKDPQTGPDT
jgi:two-component system NtrC family response regulator